jgi:F-type H+-transporting ATPase subunit delta
MAISSAALKYVNALTDVADLSELKAVAAGLSEFSVGYKSSLELRLAIQNPAIPLADRVELVAGLARSGSKSDKLVNLLKLLVDNSRIDLLEEILETLRLRIVQLENNKAVTVVSAREVPHAEKADFERAIAKQLGAVCQVAWKVDSSLIGGVQVKVGDTLLDRSVAGAIDRAERELFAC